MSGKITPLAAVVLAAGKGTRMKSGLPKVAHLLAGLPLINHVLESVAPLEPVRTVAVVGSGDRLVSKLAAGRARTVVQKQRLGTAHALARAAGELGEFSGSLLVLCGDAPLITTATLEGLIGHHLRRSAWATILSARLPDPKGYGRIVRSPSGTVDRIAEEADATGEERRLDEVNSGTYCFRSPEIWDYLERIGDVNRKGEFYLTDVIEALRKDSRPVEAFTIEDGREIRGINSRRQLAEAEKIMQDRIVALARERGVTVVRPDTVHIEAGVEIGPSTVIEPFVMIRRGARIGSDCRIGPFALLEGESVVPDGTELSGAPFSRPRTERSKKGL